MARAFCIPGVFFLLAATVLLIFASVSAPLLPALDVVRTRFPSGSTSIEGPGGTPVTQLRLGNWGYCEYDTDNVRTCVKQRSYGLIAKAGNNTATINRSWTRGLAVHPVAAAFAFVALLLSLSEHVVVELVASIMSLLGAVVTLIAFAIDIALVVYVRHRMNGLGVKAHTYTAPSFWLTFASLILLLLASCTVCFGHRKDRRSRKLDNTTTTTSGRVPFWRRFGRNRRAAPVYA